MHLTREKALESAAFVKNRMPGKPDIAILTGTGLGDCVASMEASAVLAYKDIPYFPVSTVASHRGRLLIGRLRRRALLVLQGRLHLYEGYTPAEVTFPIRVLQALGISTLIVTNAAGGLNPGFTAGDIMVIKDHINLTGSNPLTGPNEDAWGVRFPDMGAAYDRDLADLALAAGSGVEARTRAGVYVGLPGPALETPAEVRYLRLAGADAVGFSTVQEVIAAVHGSMRVLGLSTITNVHDPEHPAPASVEEIIAVAQDTAPHVNAVIERVLEKI